jgi:metal-sulfur cluster biosynthetic enzyme
VTALRDAVWRALDTVLDPELDEPVTDLDFVESCTVSDEGVATVILRLPTFFCAPNFSFLMVADAYDAVSAVEGSCAPTSRWPTTTRPPRSTTGWRRRPASWPRSRARPPTSSTSCGGSSSTRP